MNFLKGKNEEKYVLVLKKPLVSKWTSNIFYLFPLALSKNIDSFDMANKMWFVIICGLFLENGIQAKVSAIELWITASH